MLMRDQLHWEWCWHRKENEISITQFPFQSEAIIHKEELYHSEERSIGNGLRIVEVSTVSVGRSFQDVH